MGSAVNGVADGILKAAALAGVAGVLLPLAVQYGHCADGWLDAGKAFGAKSAAIGVGFLSILVLAEAANAAFVRAEGPLRQILYWALVAIGALAVHSVVSVLSGTLFLVPEGAECVDGFQAIAGSN